MALTKISTDGVKDDAVTAGKIPANAVGSSELADNAVDTAAIANSAVTAAKIADDAVTAAKLASSAVVTASIVDDAVTADKIANSVNSAIAANTAKTSNATHTGEVTGGTALTIADDVVDEANLKVSNSPTNGYLLSAQSGNTGGLTWVQSPSSDLVDDTSPQLGGNLDTNGNNIVMGDAEEIQLGNSTDFQIFHGGTHSHIVNSTNELKIRGNDIRLQNAAGNENYFVGFANSYAAMYYDNTQRIKTTSYGTLVTGVQSTTSSVRFSVRASQNDVGFGTNHGSGITTYDVSYLSPIPIFSSRSVGVDTHSGLSFGSYASGEYLKYTVPYDGVYCFESLIGFALHDSNDWFAVGMMVNTTSNASSGDIPYNQMMLQFARDGVDSGNGQHGAVFMELSANDYVVFFQQSSANVKCRGNTHVVRGTLVN